MPIPPTPFPPRRNRAFAVPIVINRMRALFLLLVFIASAIFTITYLQNAQDAQAHARVEESQTAAAHTATDTSTLSFTTPTDPFASTTVQARAVYVYDLTEGRVLYARNAEVQLPLASITKVPMALAVAEVLAPDTHVTIPYDTAPTGSAERLVAGDVWRAADLIDFTLAASSNDGAEILASAAAAYLHAKYPQSPAADATLWRMNDIAHALGLTKTYFLNVSGLDESATQSGAYGSARDVARLFAYAASTSPQTFKATTHASFTSLSLSGTTARAVNTDRALDDIPGIVMGKTGYTDLAGGNLAVVFDTPSGHRIVAVVLGSTESGRFDDMKALVAAVQKAR